MQKVHFQSSDREWETPPEVFEPLKKEFNIVFDVCASANNTKCKGYYDKKANGLTQPWTVATELGGAAWMNPPYGRGINSWVKKAHEETLNGVTTIALIPARTDTSWFQNYILNKHEVRYLKGRVKFVGAESAAPFPSMVVIFKPISKESIITKIWKKLKF